MSAREVGSMPLGSTRLDVLAVEQPDEGRRFVLLRLRPLGLPFVSVRLGPRSVTDLRALLWAGSREAFGARGEGDPVGEQPAEQVGGDMLVGGVRVQLWRVPPDASGRAAVELRLLVGRAPALPIRFGPHTLVRLVDALERLGAETFGNAWRRGGERRGDEQGTTSRSRGERGTTEG